MVHMPQEIEVWYILPAIRSELAKILVKEQGITQKEIAKILGLTAPAVSQYLKSKRGKEVVFEKNIIDEIKISAKRIAKDRNMLMNEMQRICNLSNTKLLVCRMHKGKDGNLPECCDVCLS